MWPFSDDVADAGHDAVAPVFGISQRPLVSHADKPSGPARIEQSQFPAASAVETKTNSCAATNSRIRSFRWSST